MGETWVWSLGQEDPLEKGMATHSSILAWRITWTEKTGRLHSVGSQRVRHDWAANTHTHTHKTETGSQIQQRDLWLSRGRRGAEGVDWDFEVSRWKLLQIECISNQILMYSTGHYIQYPGIHYNGKEYKKECVCMYNWVTMLYRRN